MQHLLGTEKLLVNDANAFDPSFDFLDTSDAYANLETSPEIVVQQYTSPSIQYPALFEDIVASQDSTTTAPAGDSTDDYFTTQARIALSTYLPKCNVNQYGIISNQLPSPELSQQRTVLAPIVDPSQSQFSSHAQAVFNIVPSSLYQTGEPSRFQGHSEVFADAQSSSRNPSSRVNPSKKPAVPKKKTSTPNKRISRDESSSTVKTYFNSPLKKLESLKLDKMIEIPKGSERPNWCRCK